MSSQIEVYQNRPTRAIVSLENLRNNFNIVKSLTRPGAQIMGVVKANAYGHGVKDCLAALKTTDAFGVACLEEALEIRQLGYSQPITLVEGVFSQDEMTHVIAQRVECVVHP